MFYLHVSNKTENLLKHLGAVVDADRTTSFFEKEIFLIQSRGMERMLSQGLTDLFGCWCNFEYLLPLGFLNHIGERLGMQIALDCFDRDVLTWRIEEQLRDLHEIVYAPLRGYIKGENLNLKRYQLARKLANIFDQYQMMRPDMLEAWGQGRLWGKHPAERWQAHLWRRLLEEHPDSPHRGVLLKMVIERLQAGELSAELLPARLFIFGLNAMPPLFLQYLSALSVHSQVHLFLLSPCEQYWGDIDNKRRQVSRNISLLKKGEEAEAIQENHHPLLASLGKQGSEFQQLLLDGVNFELELKSFEDPLDQAEPNLLHHIQSDLLADEVKVVDEGGAGPVNDGSLKIISAHSRVRELMILKDYILDWLHNDHDLESRDIIVMAPDIQEYGQLIPAIFEGLPHSIADSNMGKRNKVVAAFLEFIDVITGRYGWSELFDLFSKSIIHRKFTVSADDLDQLRHWIIDSGVRWGLSAAQREDLDLPAFNESSWRAGLDRLLMGYAVDSDEFVGDVLPYTDLEGRQAEPLGGLCHFVELLDQAREDFSIELTLAQWSRSLLGYAERLFADHDEPDLIELRTIIGELHLKFSQFHRGTIGLVVINQWLEMAVTDSRSSSGFLRGGITFCSMLPMRSIPFQCVCLLGVDNGVFPAQDRFATFDIMGERPRWGDRSKRVDDRYQFLEAILAARKNLYISFMGQSDKSNNSIPPSVVVNELLELLEYGYGIHDMVEEHPLQPFSREYFSTGSRLFSYDKNNCRVAQTLAQKGQELAPWWQGELGGLAEQTLRLSSLLSFYANPQRWFVRERLGIRIDSERAQVAERETFGLGGLDSYMVNQEIVDGRLDGLKPSAILSRLQAAGRWPLASSGMVSFARKMQDIEDFVEIIKLKDMGNKVGDIDIDMQVGRHRLVGRLTNMYEGGMLLYRYANCKGRDLLHGYIFFLILSRMAGVGQEVHVLTRDNHVMYCPGHDPGPTLEKLLDIYLEGWQKPSEMFVEPGFHYFQQQNKPRARVKPIEKAQRFFENQLEKNDFRQTVSQPEWKMLFNGLDRREVIGEQFVCWHEEITGRIFSLPVRFE